VSTVVADGANAILAPLGRIERKFIMRPPYPQIKQLRPSAALPGIGVQIIF